MIVAKEDNFGAIAGVVTRSLVKDHGLASGNLRGGMFVVRGAGNSLAVPGDAASVARVDGVTVHPKIKLQASLVSFDPVANTAVYEEYQTDDDVVFLAQGEIYAVCETDMDQSSEVYVRHTASATGSYAGAIRSNDDGGNAALVPGVRVVKPSTGFAPCLVTVNLPA